jgi:hypothetical protein
MKNFSKVLMFALVVSVVSSPAFGAGAATAAKDAIVNVPTSTEVSFCKSVTNKIGVAKDYVVAKTTDAKNYVVNSSAVAWIDNNRLASAGIAAAVVAASAYYFYVYKAEQKKGAYCPSSCN